MPEITVTETQRETLAEIRSDLSAAYIDTYGQIRTEDVVQYLLDTYTPPEQRPSDAAYDRIATAEFPLLQQVATDVEGVPGSGIDAETMRGELLSALGVETFAARLAAVDTDGADTEADSGTGDDENGAPADEPSARAETADSDESESSDMPESDADSATGGPGGAGSADSILSAANQLLSDHDDKWREGDGDEPYEVDLPDGTSKKVRTKDDIRQVLFKHY